MRILITGSRDWTDRDAITRAIVTAQAELAPIQPGQYDYNHGDWTIVHGQCPTGADAIADDWALGNCYQVERHPADWRKHGKAAGPLRNGEMVKAGADICLAFIKNGSRGATGCARLAEKAGIRTIRYTA